MEETTRENLEIGKTYYIENLIHDYNNKIIRNYSYPKTIGTFVKSEESEHSNGFKFVFFKNFKVIHNRDFSVYDGYDVHLNLFWKFYEVKKYKIQTNMEIRACNMILQKIIGDEYFQYVVETR